MCMRWKESVYTTYKTLVLFSMFNPFYPNLNHEKRHRPFSSKGTQGLQMAKPPFIPPIPHASLTSPSPIMPIRPHPAIPCPI